MKEIDSFLVLIVELRTLMYVSSKSSKDKPDFLKFPLSKNQQYISLEKSLKFDNMLSERFKSVITL
jgi:hypothetical protein